MVLTDVLNISDSFSDKVAYEKNIEKVTRNCSRKLQKFSANNLTEGLKYTEAISGKVAYEIIKEKVSGKRFSRLQSFSKQNAVKL